MKSACEILEKTGGQFDFTGFTEKQMETVCLFYAHCMITQFELQDPETVLEKQLWRNIEHHMFQAIVNVANDLFDEIPIDPAESWGLELAEVFANQLYGHIIATHADEIEDVIEENPYLGKTIQMSGEGYDI